MAFKSLQEALDDLAADIRRIDNTKPPRPHRLAPLLNGMTRTQLMFLSEDALRCELMDTDYRASRAAAFCDRMSRHMCETGPCDFWSARQSQIAVSVGNEHNDQTGLVREVEALFWTEERYTR